MAINGVVHAGKESKWGIIGAATSIGETTFGTAQLDSAACEMLQGPIPSVSANIHRDLEKKFGDGRILNFNNAFDSQAGTTRVISFSDVVVRQKDLGVLLYLVCQNVSENASTPYEKTFTFSTSTTQPNFSANAGMFATVGIYDTIASYHRKFTSCILRTLTLSADLQGDGLLRASGEFISGHADSTTANFSGTWAYNTQAYYNFHVTPTKKIAAADIVLYGFDITITNNAVRVGSTGATGDCETFALPAYDITGNIKCKYDVNTQGLFAADRANSNTAIQLACGTDGATGNFDYTCAGNFLVDIADDYEGAMGRALNIPFTAATTAVFTCSDALFRAW